MASHEWRTAQTADLLRLLALHVDEPVPVDVLVRTPWPKVDDRRGRASLRTAASSIRTVLGEPCVSAAPPGTAAVARTPARPAGPAGKPVRRGRPRHDLALARRRFELFEWVVGSDSWLPRESVLRLLARAAVRSADGRPDDAADCAGAAADTAESTGLVRLAAEAHRHRAACVAAASSARGVSAWRMPDAASWGP